MQLQCSVLLDGQACAAAGEPCEHFCDDLQVGYRCRCRSGYQLLNKTRCEGELRLLCLSLVFIHLYSP